MPVVSEAGRTILKAASLAVAALATARSLGASVLPLTGALEQLSEVQQHLLDPTTRPPSLFDYVEYTPTKKLRAEPEQRWAPDSAWDPDPVEEQIQVSRCRACLLEIMRRAAHDWVLYKTHSELSKRQIAQHAHTWLFEEGPGHPWWHQRNMPKGQTFTSFLSICNVLDLDPTYVRSRIRLLTSKQIMTAGRPAERRRRGREESTVTEHEVAETVSIEELEGAIQEGRSNTNSYERQFAVTTPGYV